MPDQKKRFLGDKPVLVAEDEKRKGGTSARQVLGSVASISGWTGWVLVLAGGTDFGLTWYPMNFGSQEWEFATVTSSFNALPVILLGLLLVQVAAALMRRRWWSYPASLISWTLGVFLVFAAVLWATNVPLALDSVQGPILTGIKKAVSKTAMQAVIYPPMLFWMGWKGFAIARAEKPLMEGK